MSSTSSSNVEVYLFLSPEIERTIADNRTTISELLRKLENLDITETSAVNPTTIGDTASREVVTVLLASAALVAALTPALSRVIEGITGSKAMVREQILEPTTVADANPAVGPATPKVLRWVERPLNSEFTIKGPLGIEISSRTS